MMKLDLPNEVLVRLLHECKIIEKIIQKNVFSSRLASWC